ncbi:acylating sulfoacetaldehyde dehydrogenase [Telmatospirillum siberiense]|uniref:Sulfoacetaldehyde dehydrogenase n=1 Tax=Telmatospirillum siberiense TaxID=382514 RepID=A0A2N3PU92_9PROT|nr:aldehyde dehydrogenase family protein [Telmatospirillum siberiense]PKU23973.1 sulfoacetaldehyde dehydrogenase [Telmatospirillum siberiense]
MSGEEERTVQALIARARNAQRQYARNDQEKVDLAVAAAGWAILDPDRNRILAEQAVRETGLGNVADKIRKNHRKTLGLLGDLRGTPSVGVIRDDPATGITEIANPVGVVAAITPSTNPAATPANNIINALKGRNAIILAPSPKGAGVCATLLGFIHRELAKVGVSADLVQMLPPPATKAQTLELMRQANLVVATGSRANVRAAYSSGTPALGVGVGNAAVIVAAEADPARTATHIALSKTFDNATSCSSENSLVVIGDIWPPLLSCLEKEGGILATPGEKAALEAAMFPDGKLNPAFVAQTAPRLARLAGLERNGFDSCRFIMVEEPSGTAGPDRPFSGEKLSPVLTIYHVPDFDAGLAQVRAIYDYQGKGHSVGVHGATPEQILRLGLELPVCRVIVDQPHCIATGGSFDNGLPFSLSMGCGTWGGNGFSENLNYLHFLNVTRIVRPIPPRTVGVETIFHDYWQRYGR